MPVFAKPLLPQRQCAELLQYSPYCAPSQNSLEKQGVLRKRVICVNSLGYPSTGRGKSVIVKISRFTRNAARVAFVVVALSTGNSVLAADNDDVVPPELQSDEQISVWVDDASLGLFVSQLATITGREAQVEGEMTATVSGIFNGSILDALSEVREQTPVIFDMDETTLAVVPESARSMTTVTLGTTAADDQLLKTLMTDMPPGNDILVRDGEALISGHPAFVQRTAKTMTVAFGKIEKVQIAATAEKAAKVDLTEPVVADAAAQAMLREDVAVPDASVQTETASTPRPIRWVTDIPGYDTF